MRGQTVESGTLIKGDGKRRVQFTLLLLEEIWVLDLDLVLYHLAVLIVRDLLDIPRCSAITSSSGAYVTKVGNWMMLPIGGQVAVLRQALEQRDIKVDVTNCHEPSDTRRVAWSLDLGCRTWCPDSDPLALRPQSPTQLLNLGDVRARAMWYGQNRTVLI